MRLKFPVEEQQGQHVHGRYGERQAWPAPAMATRVVAGADIDNDGQRIFLSGTRTLRRNDFRNNGNGTFEDVAHRAGVDQVRFTKGVVVVTT